jgi:hypothetical protein
MRRTLAALAASLVLAACVTAPAGGRPASSKTSVPATAADGQKSLAETCPNLTAKEIERIEHYKGQFSENAIFARAYCISVEEAERRMAIQLRDAVGPRTDPGPRPPPSAPDASVGTLQEKLSSSEADTFAGLWIQNQPTYGVMVAFTRNAAATLAKYTKDPLYIPVNRPGPTLKELRAAQERLVADFQRLGIRWAGIGGNETAGTIEVDLAQDAAPIRAAAREGKFQLPDFVRFNEPQPLPYPAPPPAKASDTRVKSFPQRAFRTDMFMSTLVGVSDTAARLLLTGGCLKLQIAGEELQTALWQASDSLDLSDPARVAVLDRLSGARVFADSEIMLSGLQPGERTPPKELVGTAACPGPYRVVRGFLPREAWDKRHWESAIAARLQTLGSQAAAEADYAADMARLPGLRAWRDDMLQHCGDRVAAVWIDEEQGTAHLLHTSAATPAQLVPKALQRFVTAQVVPQGADALETARAQAAAQVKAAGVDARVETGPIEGYVHLYVTDLAALSRAAVAGRITVPRLVRVEMNNQSPVMNQDVSNHRDPEAIWYRLEKHPDFAAIRALVAQTPIMRPEPPRPGQTAERWVARKPSKAGSLQQTHFLIAYGQTLRDIQALRRAGFDPIEALEAMNGRPTLEKRALTATDIVIAEPVAIDPADSGPDGFASTVRWRVIETLKGTAKPGEELRQRLASGNRATEAGITRYGQSMDEPILLPGLPTSLETGSRWVLHLNDALYRHSAYALGGDGAARSDGRWYNCVPWMPPSRIGADGIVRPVTTYPEPVPLAQLRARLLPIRRALGGNNGGQK